MNLVFSLLSLLLLIAIACSSETTTDSATGPTIDQSSGGNPTAVPHGPTRSVPTPTPRPQVTVVPSFRSGSGKVVEGGTFLRLGSDPPTLDPHLTTDVDSAVYAVEIYGGLMTIDKNLSIVDDLAETWDVSQDGRTTTFRLHPNAKFDVLFQSKSNNNQSQYTNGQVDLLLERARIELDESARFELYHQAEEIIVDDALWVPLWHSNGGAVLIKPEVNNYFLFPLVIPKYRYVYFTE